MPRASWPLVQGRPSIQVTLTDATGSKHTRTILADTGAGAAQDQFDLVLPVVDCLKFGGRPTAPTAISGAYVGVHPVFRVAIEIPQLGFRDDILAVGVPSAPPDFDRIACFRFLNRFNYGNFGDPQSFSLEV